MLLEKLCIDCLKEILTKRVFIRKISGGTDYLNTYLNIIYKHVSL